MGLMLAKTFILWISLLPLVVYNGLYEGPKIYYFLFGSICLVIFWIVKLVKNPESLKFETRDKWYLLWLIILTLSSIFGMHPLESLTGGSYRHQGVIFFLALWIVAKTAQLLSESERKLLIKGVALSVLIECVVIIYQYATKNLYFGRPLGTLGEVNALSGFLAMGLYFVYESFPKRFLIIPGLLILLNLSRAGILSLATFLTIFVGKLKIKFKRPVIILTAISMVSFIIYLSFGRGASPFESRTFLWKLALKSASVHPILGYGAESGETIYNQAFYDIHIPLYDLIIDRAHNLVLDITLWSGILGLTFFLGFLYATFKSRGEVGRIAILSFLVYSMFQPISVVHWLLFFLIV